MRKIDRERERERERSIDRHEGGEKTLVNIKGPDQPNNNIVPVRRECSTYEQIAVTHYCLMSSIIYPASD